MQRTGAIGALLDIYADAIQRLQRVLSSLKDDQLTSIIDPHTTDDNCRSLQAILTHVVHAGYGYATSIQNQKGTSVTRPDKAYYTSLAAYTRALDEMLAYTYNAFAQLTDADLEIKETAEKMKTGWGQYYDTEQLMEHAIVHILRHQRQIQRLWPSGT